MARPANRPVEARAGPERAEPERAEPESFGLEPATHSARGLASALPMETLAETRGAVTATRVVLRPATRGVALAETRVVPLPATRGAARLATRGVALPATRGVESAAICVVVPRAMIREVAGRLAEIHAAPPTAIFGGTGAAIHDEMERMACGAARAAPRDATCARMSRPAGRVARRERGDPDAVHPPVEASGSSDPGRRRATSGVPLKDRRWKKRGARRRRPPSDCRKF